MPEISHYMEILLKSKFPQFELLKPDDFLKELEKRNIHLNKNDLEYFDKQGILRPCLRLNRPVVNKNGEKYASLMLKNPHYWKEFYKKGYIEFPKDGDFKPWKSYLDKNKDKKSYLDKNKDKTWLFYHPWQILFVKGQTSGEIFHFKGREFLRRKIDANKAISYQRKNYRYWLKTTKQRSLDEYNPVIGLLMLLEESYKTDQTKLFYPHPDDSKYFRKWEQWKKKIFSPKKIIRQCSFSVKRVKTMYEKMVFDGNHLDPINEWNPLPEIISRRKKLKLKGDALSAQDYFNALQLLSFLVKDLTGEMMPSPYDSGSWRTGWKETIYGKPYDLKSRRTQKRILADFLDKKPIIVSIIYEGDTEDKIIREIMKAVYVYPERQGIHLYNVRGSGNMTQKNLDGYVLISKMEGSDVYVIVDKDAEKYLTKHLEAGTLKQENCIIWDVDFELDNFGLEAIVKQINLELVKNGKKEISMSEVEKQMKKKSVFKAIELVVGKNNKLKLGKIVTKPELSMKIMKNRIRKIRKEYLGSDWKPVYPIEKKLKNILQNVPHYLS